MSLVFQSYALWPHMTVSDRKSTRLNSSHSAISYAVFCLKKNIAVGTVHCAGDRVLRTRGDLRLHLSGRVGLHHERHCTDHVVLSQVHHTNPLAGTSHLRDPAHAGALHHPVFFF